MKSNTGTTFLETERQKTDHSLNAERDKTNESLTNSRVLAEEKTDIAVEKNRVAADLKTTAVRKLADTHREGQRENLRGNEKKVGSKIDVRVNEERRDADNATQKERATLDAAITQERNQKNLETANLLAQERGRTDENLKSERAETDSEVHSRSKLLTNEMVEHHKTKVSLTTRDEFLAIVSHDLRNPVGSISSCADMLLRDATFSIDPEVKPWIELIKRNADAALRLISDVLDMERIAEGKLGLTIEKNNINKVIKESIESFTLAASAKNVLLRTEATKIPNVLFDKDRVSQILSNLIGNALKFTPEGGTILIGATLNEAELEISVHDNGPGIPDERKAFIFDRYAQIKSKDRRGLGLGLYISKMLVEAHKGRLWVVSKVGDGSTFYFTVPNLEVKQATKLQ